MSFSDEIKKLPLEVDIESLSFTNDGIDFTQEDIEDSEAIFNKEKKLTQGLNSRLIGMISLVGIFGTGLFLS
ncbi:MAG: hypothetical protein M5E90_08000 [Asgard group archaeon]|nr:hypothetical protein [Asgard group archaeon]